MNQRRTFLASLSRFGLWSFAAGAALLAGCSGGGGGGSGGGGNGASGLTDILITDATVDGLLSFSVAVDELRLVDGNGVATANVLLGETSIDLIGAGAAPRWVTRGDLPEGTFAAVRMSFVAGSASAISLGGAPVAVDMLSTTFDAPFASPVTIDSSSYRQITLDVDLASSLSGDPTAPPIAFDPQGAASVSAGGAASVAIDEVKGTVQSIDAADDRFVIAAFADGDQTVALGDVTVHVLPGTLLLDDNGNDFASQGAFFGALGVGTTLLEIHGNLVAGRIDATRVEVEDGGGGDAYVVKIDGRVSNLDALAGSFDLLVIEVEKGSSIATPVLAGLADPSTIHVVYDPSTVFLSDDHTVTTAAALADGQRVKVKFATFVNEPFSATRIEVEDGPEFEGVITDASGLPDTIVIHMDHDDPSIANGQVAASNTPVTVVITGAPIELDTHARPSLAASQLQTGLKLELHGTISGPPSGPTIAASKVKIHAGRFKGAVTSASAAQHAFNATMSDLKDSFGDSVTFGNVTVLLDPACEFQGDASSASSFFALHSGLAAGETLEVEVFGVGTTTPNEVLAYEIEAKVSN